jgi:hypothetical protein
MVLELEALTSLLAVVVMPFKYHKVQPQPIKQPQLPTKQLPQQTKTLVVAEPTTTYSHTSW